jgi:hypothetical protein
MVDWVSKLLQEWTVISGAPIAFISCIVVLAALIFGVLNWSYGSRLASKDDQIALLTRQRDDYREKLGGASPDQAAQKITVLERRIEEVTANRWPPLSREESAAITAALRSGDPFQIGVMSSLAACDDLAESFVRLFSDINWKSVRHSTYFSEGINTGIEVWSKTDEARSVGSAIERGTNGRLKPSFHKWETNTSPQEREISLVIGRKP